ncbi:hypothetical protein B0F90DRAFT_1791196 [Multifurca ochricompacta]|uniref:Uncharacterized protein n=1 Tax=Multifurca ochricompacta TaxID=376703 RepID=A0AAD4LWC3_9AGAM|nr:hypothetical protein B0F90DRAFT_1791196 [Multifurca ochricompacta]
MRPLRLYPPHQESSSVCAHLWPRDRAAVLSTPIDWDMLDEDPFLFFCSSSPAPGWNAPLRIPQAPPPKPSISHLSGHSGPNTRPLLSPALTYMPLAASTPVPL